MTAGPDDAPAGADADFVVRLDNFEGPFDLLLQLISKHRLDITEVALSVVTDEFIAHIKRFGAQWDLEQTTSFLVVASTLVDLKAARLLPQGEVDDVEDLELLEARDLLFARLLQYRAFKLIASWMAETLSIQGRRFARPGGLETQFLDLLPEVELHIGPEDLAVMAARAMEPKQVAEVSLAHVHRPMVSVAEQAEVIMARLSGGRQASFRSLCAGADTMTVVARFLAVLELYRRRAVAFEQLTPLGELVVRWSGDEADTIEISDEFDGGPSTGTGEDHG